MGMCGTGRGGRGERVKWPSAMAMFVPGGITYTRLASTGIPSVASTTGIRLTRDKIGTRWLFCSGSRWLTRRRAKPGFADRSASNSEYASSPPAEAPTPTTRNGRPSRSSVCVLAPEVRFAVPGMTKASRSLPQSPGTLQGSAAGEPAVLVSDQMGSRPPAS